MKIHLCILLCFLCACNNTQKNSNTLRLKLLRGPSSIAFAQLMESQPVIDGMVLQTEVVDSPELIQAQLIKGEADIAVLPMISAVNLYNKGVTYPLLGCPLWGTLYLVGRDSSATMLHLFGSGTSPDILTRYYLDKHKSWQPKLNYTFGSARDIMMGIQTGTVETAVLSEPFVSMALAKDSTLKILADLNRPLPDSPGFAQTAVVFSPKLAKFRKEIDKLLAASCKFAVDNPEQAIRIMEESKVFGKGMLSKSSIQRCRINYVPACEAKEAVSSLLRIILQYEPKAIGGHLPDSTFVVWAD